MNRHLFGAALGVLFVIGCATSTTPSGNAPVGGTWSYSGNQNGSDTVITGTLTFNPVTDGTLSGTLSLTESSGGGSVMFAGPVSGQSLDSTAIVFYATFPDRAVREHGAVLTGDTLTGNWHDQGGSVVGSFTAIRTGP